MTASIGLALGQYSSPDELLRDADLALYAAKAEGKDRYVLFDAGLYADAEGRVELELDLSSALRERAAVPALPADLRSARPARDRGGGAPALAPPASGASSAPTCSSRSPRKRG